MKDSMDRNAFFYLMKNDNNSQFYGVILQKLIQKGKSIKVYLWIDLKLDEHEKMLGDYPLTYAAHKNMLGIVTLLLENMVNPNLNNEKNGKN